MIRYCIHVGFCWGDIGVTKVYVLPDNRNSYFNYAQFLLQSYIYSFSKLSLLLGVLHMTDTSYSLAMPYMLYFIEYICPLVILWPVILSRHVNYIHVFYIYMCIFFFTRGTSFWGTGGDVKSLY